jgi:hypothetical protein
LGICHSEIMKTTIAICGVAVFLAGTFQSKADIMAGPYINPANGHEYYLLTPNTWRASEAEAEQLGGTLAVIRNEAEQEWVFSRFGTVGGSQRSLWIGFHRKSRGGEFIAVDGSPVDYTDWYPGEPNNTGGSENYVEMRWDTAAPGTWNDLNSSFSLSGVVEVSGKPDASLVKQQERLVGAWYEGGKADRPCYITAAGNTFFAINGNNMSGRIILSKSGLLFVTPWQMHGETVPDAILWSNGTWWSRQPAKYENIGYRDGTSPELF